MLTDTDITTLPKKKVNIQPKWKNAPSYSDLNNDLKSAENYQEVFKDKLLLWEETRDGGPAVKASGLSSSKVRPKVVRKQNEWKYPALEDPLLSTNELFKIEPTTYADVEAARQNGEVLNYQWNTKVQKVKLVNDIVRTVVDEGTVIVKTGWEYDSKIETQMQEQPIYASPEESLMMIQQAVQSGQMSQEQAQAMLETGEPVTKGIEQVEVEVEVTTKNQPTYEVCVNANVVIDPTCDGIMEDARFVIHEYDTSYSELKSEEHGVDENGEEYGIYYNIDHVLNVSSEAQYDEHLSDASNDFEFKDKARKRLRAYEYWGYWDIQGDGELVSIVATWVGNTLIRLEENPFPHGRVPFSIATYMPVKKSVHGEPDAELLKENQDTIGNMTRAINDTVSKIAAGQEFIDENLFPSPSVKNQYDKGYTVYYRSQMDPRKSIYRQDIPNIGDTPFNVINWQNKDANELTGTTPFSQSRGPKDGGTEQSRDSMDATAKRELGILRRLSHLLFVDMARMTIAMNQAWLSEEEVIRVTDEEFVTVKRDDLQGDFDLRVEVSTPEKDEADANKLWKLLQTNAATMDPELVKLHYVQLARLWNFDKLAKEVQDFKPQPNPKQEKLLDLQIQEQQLKNAMLMKEMEDYDSKIAERISRAEGNSNDDDLTAAKAKQALAVADKLEAETDVIDASFLKLQSGEQRQEDIEDQQFKADVDMAKEQNKSDVQMARDQLKRAALNVPAKTISEI